MEYLLIISVLVSFLLTVIVLPKWIRICQRVGLVWEDMNKFKHPKKRIYKKPVCYLPTKCHIF